VVGQSDPTTQTPSIVNHEYVYTWYTGRLDERDVLTQQVRPCVLAVSDGVAGSMSNAGIQLEDLSDQMRNKYK